ncbi:hypothetical protein B6I21_09150 [candidate division KSB1 bacterium 4572_119]|nr:MAG: hypothetical protein B6I21_09150 [candidate division KSB1 bacterium 4572_119]
MKRLQVVVLVVCLVLTMVSVQTNAAPEEGKSSGVNFLKTNFSEALAKAVKANKPLMIDFWSDG